VDLDEDDEIIVSFKQFSNHNLTKHIGKSSIIPRQLIIKSIHSGDNPQLFVDNFERLLVAVPYTRLNINCEKIFTEMFVTIVQLLPNLDSLKLSSLLHIEPEWLYANNGDNFFLASINNKITKVNIETITDIEQMHFIFYICRYIQYFQVNIPD
jgi:hypothetical protein